MLAECSQRLVKLDLDHSASPSVPEPVSEVPAPRDGTESDVEARDEAGRAVAPAALARRSRAAAVPRRTRSLR